MKRSYRLAAVGALAAACSMVMAGCTAAEESSATLQLHWSWEGSAAGFAVAEAEGLYDEAGIEALQGTGSGTAVQVVTGGQADIGVAESTAIIQQIIKGSPLVIVATIYQSTPMAMQALPDSGIETIADLKGKTVAVPQTGAYAFVFPLLLELNGLSESDVTIANMGTTSTVPSLLQGNVDAIIGGDDTHVSLLEQDAEFKNWPFAENGISMVGHSIFTTREFLEENPDAVRSAVRASLEGFSDELDDPEGAVEAVKSLLPDAPAGDVRVSQLEDALLPLLCTGGAEYVGSASMEHWQEGIDQLFEAGLIEESVDPREFVTNDYLPEQSELRSCE